MLSRKISKRLVTRAARSFSNALFPGAHGNRTPVGCALAHTDRLDRLPNFALETTEAVFAFAWQKKAALPTMTRAGHALFEIEH